MVQVYEQVKQTFTVDDYGHYVFTPRDLTRWVMGLLRYDLANAQNDSSSEHVLEVWTYEANRLFRDKIVGIDNQSKFDNIISSVLRGDWNANIFDKLQGESLTQ